MPTRITAHSATLIDNIFTNCLGSQHINGLLFQDISDHLPIFAINLANAENIDKNRVVHARDTSTANVIKFRERLANFDWSTILSIDNPIIAYDNLLSNYSCIYNDCFPLRRINIRNYNRNPWLTTAILKSIKMKSKLYKRYLRKPTPVNEHKYKVYKNMLIQLIRSAKCSYYENQLRKNKSNIKNTWRILNIIINKRVKNKVNPNTEFHHHGNVISDPTAIADRFCHYFTNIGLNLRRNLPEDHDTPSPSKYLTRKFCGSFFLSPVCDSEVRDVVKSFKPGKALGFDNIHMSIIKQTIDLISLPLMHTINLSFEQGIVPDQIKIARVIPVFKHDDESNITNYRPISILPAFSKIFERIISNRMLTYIEKHNILIEQQYGFRKGRSTSLALIDLYDKVTSAIDSRKFTIGLFIDLSKAFDTVDHDILFSKLEYYGFRGLILKWLKSYLSNRTQFVDYNGQFSETRHIICGVPQGSILGPLLFLIYINDLANVSNVLEFILFADDTNIFYSHKNIDHLARVFNLELNNISVWLKANKLSLNAIKTKFIIFRPRQRRQRVAISLHIDNQTISQVTDTLFLGVIIDEYLSWKPHISCVANKIAKSIGIISRARFYLNQTSLRLLYYTMIYPYLQYCMGINIYIESKTYSSATETNN